MSDPQRPEREAMQRCYCGPRECLHPANLQPGYQCAVVLAALPPTPTPGWQDISTAPKDGTDVLLFMRRSGYAYWGIGKWFEGTDGSKGWIGQTFMSQPHDAWTCWLGEDPSHWMPMLTAPDLAWCKTHGDVDGCSGLGRPSCKAAECLYGAEPCPDCNGFKPVGGKCGYVHMAKPAPIGDRS
jgi:hypothetical protein